MYSKHIRINIYGGILVGPNYSKGLEARPSDVWSSRREQTTQGLGPTDRILVGIKHDVNEG